MLRFNTDSVVDGPADPLFATKITLRGLNRNVSEQELDLLQFSARRVKWFAHDRRRSCGATWLKPSLFA